MTQLLRINVLIQSMSCGRFLRDWERECEKEYRLYDEFSYICAIC